MEKQFFLTLPHNLKRISLIITTMLEKEDGKQRAIKKCFLADASANAKKCQNARELQLQRKSVKENVEQYERAVEEKTSIDKANAEKYRMYKTNRQIL
uniref:Uncharacterized protein n=1 Tax=Romanomermis culicivorax TaxID=13658 RepID=A0A915JNT2_ROMCU